MNNQLHGITNTPFHGLLHMLKGEHKAYAIVQTVTLITFLIFAAADVALSFHYGLVVEAGIMAGVFLLQAIAVLVMRNRHTRFVTAQNVFFITSIALVIMAILSGYSAGSGFYYFPATMVYFINTSLKNHRKRFLYFFLITLFFLVAMVLGFLLFPQQQLLPVVNKLVVTRFIFAILLSAILVKYLFSLQEYILNSDGRKEYHEALFQSYLDGYIIFKQSTKEVTDYNKRMLSLFQLPPDVELKGLYITQVMLRYLADDSANKELMMDDIPDAWHGEAGFVTHSREKFNSYVKSVVFYKDDSKYQILSIRDITNMKNAEKELIIYKESVEKAGRAKARFLSSMSHELRTPLNGIIGTSNLIKSEPNLTESIQKHIDVLLYSSEHMLGIINDILDFSKIDAGKLELKNQPFNIKYCIDNLASSFKSQFQHKNIQLLVQQSSGLEDFLVMSDEIKLSQVLANLLSNALKFTLEGNVTLIVKELQQSSSQVTLQFEVIDTGIGIPKEKQLEIFQGFSQVHAAELTRRFGGTGLGLTISEKLVTIFGGDLKVESELERGSRFFFSLVFNKTVSKPLPVVNKLHPDGEVDIRGIKILIVEDNLINATILKSFLKKWEVQIKEAENGVHALEMLKYHRFDLILMDLEMPEMDGYTAIKIIRTTDTVTPVLAFTASLLENMDELLAEAGFNGYVLKPYRPAELKLKIEQFALGRTIAYA